MGDDENAEVSSARRSSRACAKPVNLYDVDKLTAKQRSKQSAAADDDEKDGDSDGEEEPAAENGGDADSDADEEGQFNNRSWQSLL